MRIRMITFHTPKNYGAVLQAYSLMSFLKSRYDDVKVIDFNTPHLRSKYPLTRPVTDLRSLVNFITTKLFNPGRKKRHMKFDAFVVNSFDLTKRFESFKELASEPWERDVVFITGSDQVFNPKRIEEERKAFYLTFVPRGNFKISYAGSFGTSSIPQDKMDFTKTSLASFNEFSTREEFGVSIVKSLLERDVPEVLDPIFLNNLTFWKETGKPYRKRFEKYALYYRLLNSPESDRIAETIAHKTGLRLVVVSPGCKKIINGSEQLRDVGPQEFLYLFDNSDYVITNSFHGVAFSLLFEKNFEFVDFDPKSNGRGLNILKKAGLESCAYHQDGNWTFQKFDYRQINERLDEWKVKSVRFLESALKQAKSYLEQGNNDAY